MNLRNLGWWPQGGLNVNYKKIENLGDFGHNVISELYFRL